MQQPKNIEAKVVVLGTQGVGKTSIVHRYTAGHFTSLPSTIGASFLVKKLIVQGVKVRLQIWDTAGQERFRSMTPMYYRGSHAAIIVYDITSRQSFEDVRQWIDELRSNMTHDLVIHVVGSKLDLKSHSRAVDLEEAKRTINEWVRPKVEERAADSTLGRQTSPSRASRLGFGSLAMGSTASRLGFTGTSSASANANGGGSSGSGGSGSGGRTEAAAEDVAASAWDSIDVSEVSAKDDEGIEDVFLAITRRLVERKVQLERERARRDRESIMLSDPEVDNHAKQSGANSSSNSWSCC